MPKVRRTSYNVALKLKVVAEAESVENNSEIAQDYRISELREKRPGEGFQRRAEDVCETNNVGPLDSKVSQS